MILPRAQIFRIWNFHSNRKHIIRVFVLGILNKIEFSLETMPETTTTIQSSDLYNIFTLRGNAAYILTKTPNYLVKSNYKAKDIFVVKVLFNLISNT